MITKARVLAFFVPVLLIATPCVAEKPPLDSRRIALELMVGGVGGIAIGLGSALPVANQGGYEDELDGVHAAILTFAGTYVVSSAVIVQLIGSYGDNTGNFAATLLGGFLGAGGALAILAATRDAYGTIGLALVPLGSTIGFNVTRRYDHRLKSQNTLIDIHSKELSFGLPMPHMRLSAQRMRLFQHINLLKVHF